LWRAAVVGALAAIASIACSNPTVTKPIGEGGGGGGGGAGGEDACPSPGRLVAEECRAPGQQDDGCWAGEHGVDGSCFPAGIPPTGCPEHFELVGDRCMAILADKCPEGLMAPPGETSCRPPMECGSGKWGDIPVEGDTVYVDQGYTGGNSDGSADQPYLTIGAGIANAADGAIVAVAAGIYSEAPVITKLVRLWGVCPSQVTIERYANYAIILDHDGVELHGTTLRGGGVIVGDAVDVLIEGVHVLDTENLGLIVGGDFGGVKPAQATIRSTLVERALGTGLVGFGSEIEVDGCEVRDTRADWSGRALGLGVQPGPLGWRPTALVRRTRIEGTGEAGFFTSSADARLESVAVIDTAANSVTNGLGYAVAIQHGAEPSVVEIEGLYVRGSYGAGVFSFGSEISMVAATIEDVLPQASDGASGNGLVVAPAAGSGAASSVDARWCFIDNCHEAGVALTSSVLSLTGSVIRSTRVRPDGEFGHGVSVSGATSMLSLLGSVIDGNNSIGVQINDGSATLTGTVIRGTAASQSGIYGDGVVALAVDGKPSVQLVASQLLNNARAGLTVIAAEASIQNTHLVCHPIALVTQPLDGVVASVLDAGGNRCSCEDEDLQCKTESAEASPPKPLPPAPEAVPE